MIRKRKNPVCGNSGDRNSLLMKEVKEEIAKLVEVDRKATIAQITDGSIKKSISECRTC